MGNTMFAYPAFRSAEPKAEKNEDGYYDVNRNHECTENGKENAQKTVTTVHKNQ